MNKDFDKRFKQLSNQFDKDFDRARKWGVFVSIITLAFVLGLTGFGIWVVVALLQFFGVI